MSVNTRPGAHGRNVGRGGVSGGFSALLAQKTHAPGVTGCATIWGMQQNVLALPTFVVLALTFVAICWYSWETRKLRNVTADMARATRDQADMSRAQVEVLHQPWIALTKNVDFLGFENFGVGPAFEIRFNIVYTPGNQAFGNVIPQIRAGGRCKLRFEVGSQAQYDVMWSFRNIRGISWKGRTAIDETTISAPTYERIQRGDEVDLGRCTSIPYEPA